MLKSFNTPAMQVRRAQAGITLIEVSIGLIIAAIIAAAAFIAFQNNSRRSEVRENIQTLTEVISETKQKFGRTGQYPAMTTAAAIGAAVIPPALATGPDAAANTYGGEITFTGGNGNKVDLLWASVPQEQCLDLVVGLEEGTNGISIAGTAVKADAIAAVPDDPATADIDESAPAIDAIIFDLAAATTSCQSAEEVDLSFTIARN